MPIFNRNPAVPPDAAVFIGAPQVCARYGGVSHMWIERRLQDDPDFPKPVYIGRLRYWRIADLEQYERAAAKRNRPRRAAAEAV
jgi:predicted DNA-binding transcriptional regulator AlpA